MELDISQFTPMGDTTTQEAIPQTPAEQAPAGQTSSDINFDISNFTPVNPDSTSLGTQAKDALEGATQTIKNTYNSLTGDSVVSIIPTAADIQRARDEKNAKLEADKVQEVKLKLISSDPLEYIKAKEAGDPDTSLFTYKQVLDNYGKSQGLQSPIIDPLMWPFENAIGEGLLKGFAKVYDAVKMNPSIRTFMAKQTPENVQDMKNLLSFMEDKGYSPTNALIQGSNGNDLGQFMGTNLYAVRDAFRTSESLANDYFGMARDITDKIRGKGIDIANINTYKDIVAVEKEVTDGVNALRKSYKERENEAYNEVTKLVKSKNNEVFEVQTLHKDLIKELADEGVPPEAVNVVRNILNRFSKPYADETKELAGITAEKTKLLVSNKFAEEGSKQAIRAGDETLAVKYETTLQENAKKLQELEDKASALKDVREMNTEELLASVKLINRRLYKPGGAISMKDADELRGLSLAKTKLESFMENVVTDPELKQAIRTAKDITIARTGLFGAKDMGGEKVILANLLNNGEYNKVTQYLTGPSAKENLLYLRDTMGKDSQTYRSGLNIYLNDKLGFDVGGAMDIITQKKAFSIPDRVDIQSAAAKIAKLDAQDFAMVRQAIGDEPAAELKSLQKLMTNYAELEDAASKYGRGITAGKWNYVESADGVTNFAGRALKLITDGITYQAGKTAEKIIYNQPKFRTVTGAITGETIYLANTPDKELSIEGALTSALLGSAGGYAGGRVARSLLESDIAKVSRYLKADKPMGADMPKGLMDSLNRIGQRAKQVDDELAKTQEEMYQSMMK